MDSLSTLKTLLRQNRISRTTFLTRAAQLGVSTSAAMVALAQIDRQGTVHAAPSPRHSSAPVRGGTLINARTTETTGLDPHTVPSLANNRISWMLYDPLVTLDTGLVPRPALAESWEIPTSTTYIFHLRQGATFHDGSEVTADDVIYSAKRIQNPKTGAYETALFQVIEKAEAVDKYTVRFTLSSPFSSFLPTMFYLLVVPAKVGSKPQNWLMHNELGSGAWMLDTWQPNQQMVLKRNPHYWKMGQPYLDGVTIQIIPDETSVIAALRTGQVHYAALEDNSNYKLVKPIPTLATYTVTNWGTNVVNINHRKEPFKNLQVLQAMSMAIDRNAILQVAGAGLGQVSGPLPASHRVGYIPTSQLPFYTPDPAGAKKLLAQAGYPNGFTMDVIYIPQFPLMALSAQVLAAQWSAIGINAKPRATEYGVWLDLRVKSYDYFISTNLSFPAFDSSGYLYNTYLTGSGPATWDGWSDATTDLLLKKLEAAVKPADQQALLTTIEKRLVTQCASWWTYAQTNVEVAQLNVKGLHPHPSELPLSLDGVWFAK